MTILHQIHNLENQYVLSMLFEEFSKITKDTYIKNYHPDYQNYPGNIFFILKNGRYAEGKGCYYVIEEAGKYVASAGWNEYELSTDTALILTRTYINPEFRNNFYLAKHILPLAIESTSCYTNRWITCNEYNKTIYKWFEQAHSPNSKSFQWPAIYKNFKPVGKKDIYNVQQYVVEYQNLK